MMFTFINDKFNSTQTQTLSSDFGPEYSTTLKNIMMLQVTVLTQKDRHQINFWKKKPLL